MRNATTLPISQSQPFSPYAIPGLNRQLTENKTAMSILEMVSKSLEVSIPNILGFSRTREKVIARHIAMYLIYTRTKLGYKPVGSIFGRDHTTVMHACKVVRDNLTFRHETDIVTHLRNIENQLIWLSSQQ